MDKIFDTVDPLLLLSAMGALCIFAFAFAANQYFNQSRSRSDVKKRLSAKSHAEHLSISGKETAAAQEKPKSGKKIGNKVAKRANDFYANSDPNSIKKLRMMLIQAGYMNPNAVGYFIAARFGMALVGAAIGLILVVTSFADKGTAYKLGVVVSILGIGYFLPNFYLSKRASAIETKNRQGFPDILDLMVVSAEAGLTMEASIERITQEIKDIYPNLAMQLNMASLEIRAGRPIDQALRAFGERLKMEEVKGFATMVQQAKELGTSVSDAL
ncbi:MAG: type II secretion system F family protein, partial [Pseudomonadota bacterium]